jgi:diacylglycerol kinase family enzyme
VTAFLAVTNAAAGQGSGTGLDAALAVLRSAGDLEVCATNSAAETADVLSRRGDRRIVVCGGDGSLHTVIAALRRHGALADAGPIGLVPLGTGNDLARSAGIPLDPAQAARVAVDGVPRPRELLLDDEGGIVVNAVHVGIGAQAGRAAQKWKPRIGMAAYPMGSVIAGARSPGWRLRIEVDQQLVTDVDSPVLMVGLALGSSIGGGAPLAPDAEPDDGLVDVVISYAIGPVARLGYALHLRRGDHVKRDDVHATLANTVTISGQPFPWNADGELGASVRRRTWVVQRRAWQLLVPRPDQDRNRSTSA